MSGESDIVEFRPFEEADFDRIVPIMQELWHAGYGDAAFQRLAAADDLAHMLGRCTFARVALVDGAVCGIVLARVGAVDAAWAERWRLVGKRAHEAMEALDPAHHAQASSFIEGEAAVNRALLASSDLKDGGELVLLALGAAARGHGIGRKLLDIARTYLAEHQALPGYLLTDTSCDWQFYEHLGLTRAVTHVSTPAEREYLADEMYLYRLG